MKNIKKINEFLSYPSGDDTSNNKTTVYVVLFWYWEGDSNLVNTYEDCFLSKEDALTNANKILNQINKNYARLKKDKFFGDRYEPKVSPKIYMFDEPIPDEGDGAWGVPGFVQIIKKEF